MRSLMGLVLLGASAWSPAAAQQCVWLQQSPDHPPALWGEPSIAFDSARSVTVLFNCGAQNLRDTLEWNGSDWSLRSSDGPRSRDGTAMTYDSKRGGCVLFGGRYNDHTRADTWIWDGKAWTQVFPDHTPSSRYNHAMAHDSNRDVTVLFGGDDDNDEEFGDTWEWNGADWTKASDAGPKPRYSHAMAFDSNRGVTVLYGGAGPGVVFGDTWEWDGKSWTKRTDTGPLGKLRLGMTYSPDRQVCVLYGGNTDEFGNDPSDETWLWNGEVWTKLETPANPGRRVSLAMTYDAIRSVVVMYGGGDGQGQVFTDTWELGCDAPCYPDLDGNGMLDLFDFLTFVNVFNAGTPGADCDGSKSLDLFDFLCFVNAFNDGC